MSSVTDNIFVNNANLKIVKALQARIEALENN